MIIKVVAILLLTTRLRLLYFDVDEMLKLFLKIYIIFNKLCILQFLCSTIFSKK